MSISPRFTMLDYLMKLDFMPQDKGAWFDRREGSRITRVVWDGEEETQVIALTLRSVCLYKAVLSPGTPEPVITAVIEAALAQAHAAAPGESPASSPSRRRRGRDDDR